MSQPQRKAGVQKTVKGGSGLGRAIINRRAKAAKEMADPTTATAIEAGMKSVTQESNLDEFLTTAALAGTDFTAERQNIKVVADPTIGAAAHNPYLLSPLEERAMRQKQKDNRERLQVPRRPHWTKETTVLELEKSERDSFLEWRRGLADLQENQSLLLTPFERNLEVWRQLWRTCERSDLIVQIVDARNPLSFRSEDLAKYVLELNRETIGEGEKGEGTSRPTKKNLLLINKSDLLTQKQREGWADYFESRSIQYAFFSAANSTALQDERARLESMPEEDDEFDSDEEEYDEAEMEGARMKVPKSGNKLREPIEEEDSEESGEDTDDELAQKMERGAGISIPGSNESPRTRILSVLELEDLFMGQAPEVSVAFGHSPEKMVVGLVGYPNVGKSSTINALIGEKKVSVSATPGKTKHFQTIRLSGDVLLCDCPGLVFPQFAATKADLVTDGVLPIDQMREHTGPVALITRRIPQDVLEAMYGLRIVTLPVGEGGTGVPTAAEFLTTYAVARGFFTGGQGNPDTSRASRFILKDYVNGKLLYCHPPPTITADVFNEEVRDLVRLKALNLVRTKRAPMSRVPVKADTYIATAGDQGAATALSKTRQSSRALALDRNFFTGQLVGRPGVRGVASIKNGEDFSRVRMFPHHGDVGDDGKSQKKRNDAAKAAKESEAGSGAKKHFKIKRQKQRSGRGYDD